MKYPIVHIQLSSFHTLQNFHMPNTLPSPHSPVLTICNFLLDFQVKITTRRIHKLNISCHHPYPTLFLFCKNTQKPLHIKHQNMLHKICFSSFHKDHQTVFNLHLATGVLLAVIQILCMDSKIHQWCKRHK